MMKLCASSCLALVFAIVLLAACNDGRDNHEAKPAAGTAVKQLGSVALVRTDLGLGDGELVRDADAALRELAEAGRIAYLPVGELPAALAVGAEGADLGLPATEPLGPGEMDQAAAEALLAQVSACDLLVLSAPSLMQSVLAHIASGELDAGAVLLLDDDGYRPATEPPAVPLYRIRYEVKDVAFLCGVAAAQSARNGMFVVMARAGDTSAQDFLDGACGGAKFHTNGAQVATVSVPVDPVTGEVTPELFLQARLELRQRMGDYFVPDHFIVALGRGTPSIMQALASKPDNGYVIGAYGDLRQVRPARVLGCVLKRPGTVLTELLGQIGGFDELAGLAPDGVISRGLADDAVAFTDFELYGRYNPDSADIEKAVSETERLIRAGELDYDY